ncbi:zinc-binding dehydrogenase [Oleiharenicola lentus]|uniref:zinc-binding dehydrogenase n=1 Tax=Oleiharenicola lentus TaxID=2508720 RepID=UPI003F66A3F5
MSHARVQLFHGSGQPFELRSIPLPTRLGPDEVLVEISLATICGSDLHTIEGRRSAPTPSVLGHEAVGTVVASARAGILPGLRVTWTLADSCGCCPACRVHALPQKCDELFKYGHASLLDGSGLNGCYASHILLRRGTAIFVVPEGLPDAWVAPANCALATVVNVLSELPAHCETAVVQGAGLLGIYACALLQQRGVKRVFCTDLSDQRLALVREFGGIPLRADPANWPAAAEQVRTASGGAGADLVVEVAGSAAVIPQGVAMLRAGGCYVWAGMVHRETTLALTGEAVVKKCLTIRGVHNYAPPDLAAALEFLVRTGDAYPYHKLVSPPLPLEKLAEAVALTQRREWLRVAIKANLSCPSN